MIGPSAAAKVMVATRPVDFRKGPDALAALVGAEYGGDTDSNLSTPPSTLQMMGRTDPAVLRGHRSTARRSPRSS
ncbi:MAG: hypothetical protein RLZZ444_2447 [Pseudomonadota bacterium]